MKETVIAVDEGNVDNGRFIQRLQLGAKQTSESPCCLGGEGGKDEGVVEELNLFDVLRRSGDYRGGGHVAIRGERVVERREMEAKDST